jgi:hypothetical protein
LSHANTADNDFARWLAFRLTRQGYKVWVDLNELKGGEDWWRDIEYVIRERAARFIVAMSRTSNQRDGVLKEIAIAGEIAKKLKNFIIPVRVDDLPHGDYNIEVKRFNGPDFSAGWAPAFGELLEALERDGIPKARKDGASFASERWHQAFGGITSVRVEQETYGSNWLGVDKRPEKIFWHERDGTRSLDDSLFSPAYPAEKAETLHLSFASAEELAPAFTAAGGAIARSTAIDLREFTRNGLPGAKIDPTKARDIVAHLYRLSIEQFLVRSGLVRYDMASGKACYWFSHAKAGTQQHPLQRPDGSSGRRALLGKAKQFTWHFAIELRATFNPWVSLAVIPHVVFLENGVVVPSKRTQHSLRRRVCKQWFNDQWFDRILLSLRMLSNDAGKLVIPLGDGASLESGIAPDLFISPVSYQWKSSAELAAEATKQDELEAPGDDGLAPDEDEGDELDDEPEDEEDDDAGEAP